MNYSDEYLKLLNEESKNPHVLEDAVISFLSGGVMGMTCQILVESYIKIFNLSVNLSISLTALTFIFFSALLTGFGVYDDLVQKYKFGLIIPITGFAHSIASSLMDYRKDGFITGMGSNMFKLAGSVILYGSVFALLGAIVKVIIYG